VRFETTPQFDRDWKALKPDHQRLFRDIVKDFSQACDAYAEAKAQGTQYRWPAGLRVKTMKSAPGIWEMTVHFSSPDLRGTFEFFSDESGMLLLWRRVGDHGVYGRP
jgi:hypothetical protein